MWFTSLSFYPLGAVVDAGKLETALAARKFQGCTGLEWFSQGWVSPAQHLTDMTFQSRGAALFSLLREDKVLPAGVIRDALEKKIADIDATELRKVGRKEKLTLKEQITDDLLPRAFVKKSRTNGYIDNACGLLLVDSASPARAEALLSALRDASPPFPAPLPRTVLAPHTVMTDWLAAGAAGGEFELDADAKLKDGSENGAVISIKRMDLTADEIRQHIASGKQVVELGLIWRERIRFVLTESLQLRRIQFLDVLQEEASQAGDDLPSLFEATFLLMREELGDLIDALLAAHGGLVQEATPPAAVAGNQAEETPWN